MAKTYKTQGTIASVSLGNGRQISFTIDPVEPYDFPVNEKGETKKSILLQPVSDGEKHGKLEEKKTATKKEEILKVSSDTRFSISWKEDNGVTTFGTLILLKQNRNKIEIEVSEMDCQNPPPNADKSVKGKKTASESAEASPVGQATDNRSDTAMTSKQVDSASDQPKRTPGDHDETFNKSEEELSSQTADLSFSVLNLTVK